MTFLVLPNDFYWQGSYIVRWRQYLHHPDCELREINLDAVDDLVSNMARPSDHIFIFHRIYNAKALLCLKKLKKLGCICAIDFNDDHIHSNELYKTNEHLSEILELVDVITVSSKILEQTISKKYPNKRYFLIEDYRLPIPPVPIPDLNSGLRLLYFGSYGSARHGTGLFSLIRHSNLLYSVDNLIRTRIYILTNNIENLPLSITELSNLSVKFLSYSEDKEISLLSHCHGVFLPSNDTYYMQFKTNNRLEAALNIGRPVLRTSSEDYDPHNNIFSDPRDFVEYITDNQHKMLTGSEGLFSGTSKVEKLNRVLNEIKNVI